MMSEAPATTTRIWDPTIRLFHWLLVGFVGFSWWTGEQHDMEWHRYSGYAILALLVFRLFWGFAGSRTARFGQFVKGPAAVSAYAKTLGSKQAHAADGHNPLGGWSVLAMLGALAVMVVAGLFAIDVDGFDGGPLSDYLTFDQARGFAEFHETVFNVILALVVLHIVAIGFYAVWKRQRLVPAMITGKRKLEADEAPQDLRWSPLLALTGIALGVAIAWAASTGFQF